MLSNQKSSRFYSVKGLLFGAIALALLMSVTAFASGNSRFAFIDGAAGFLGMQNNNNAPAVTHAQPGLSMMVPCANPGGGTDVRALFLPAIVTSPGATIAVPITTDDLTNCNVISYDFQLDYNQLVLAPVGGSACTGNACLTQSGTLSSGMLMTPNTGTPGHIIMSGFQAGAVCPPSTCVGGETLLILNFNVIGNFGDSSTLAFADFTDSTPAFHEAFTWNEGDPLDDTTDTGLVTIPPATPTFTNTPTPSNTATNTPTGTNTPTATSTNTNTPTPTATFTPSSTATNTNTPTPTPLCAQVDIDDKITTTGSPVTLSVTTTNTTPLIPQAFSLDTHITFDPSMLALDTAPNPGQFGVTLGPVGLSNGSQLLVDQPSPGLLVVSLFSTSAYSGAGSLFDLHFTALGAPGSFTPVYFTPWTQVPPFPSSDADGFRYNEGFPTTCLTDGSVAIGGTVGGRITYGNSILAPPVRHVPNTTVDGFGAPPVTGLSDSLGFYSLSGFGFGPYNIVASRASGVPGPAGPGPNTHGTSITAFDAARVQQNTVGIGAPFSFIQKQVADVTNNGQITSLDSTAIATWVVSLPSNYYLSGSWGFLPSSYNHAFVGTQTDDFTGLLYGEVSGNWCDPLEFGPGQCNPFGYTVAGSRPAPGPQAVVAVRNISAQTGGDVVVPVDVQGIANKGAISYQFDLKYDAAVIQPQANAVTLANTVSSSLKVVTNVVTPGVLRVAVYGAFPIADAGVLLNFHFTAVGSAFDRSPLTFENFFFNEGGIGTTITSGEVRLTPAVANTTVAD